MLKQLFIGFFFFSFSLCLNAQQASYSYITDRMFHDPSELIGYNFKPNEMEVVDETKDKLRAGEYSFGISRSNLYVEGKNIRGVYSVIILILQKYGFKLLLMNARDPTIQGHLKIILTKKGFVDALIFKRSSKEKEIIFFLPEMPDKLWKKEDAYFTDRWETKLEAPDSLWGMSVTPFMRVHLDEDGVQERLHMRDSTKISFYKTVKIIEKIKKSKKKGKKNKKNKKKEEETDDGEEYVDASSVAADSLSVGGVALDSLSEEGVKKKIKIITKYFVKVRSILTFKDGGVEDKEWIYEVENLKERVDYQAKAGEEKYEIEAKLTKGSPIMIYLNTERTFSSIEVGGKVYRMQGH